MPPEFPPEDSSDPVGSAPQKLLRFSGDEAQEIILAKAMILGYQEGGKEEQAFGFTTSFQQQGPDRVFNFEVKDTELDTLVESFRADPVRGQRICTENIIGILKDPRYTPEAREARARRYYDAYVNLLVKMDQIIFPETEEGKILQGVPDYIPDGYSDLGKLRPGRERGRVDKKELYSLMKEDTLTILKDVASGKVPEGVDKRFYVLHRITELVNTKLPYDEERVDEEIENGRSVMFGDLWRGGFGVCRHHAMYVQVLNQMFGIDSRILRNRTSQADRVPEEALPYLEQRGANHVANMVKIGDSWYLVDATRADVFPDGRKKQFIRVIPPEQNPGNGGRVFSFDNVRIRGAIPHKEKEFKPVSYIRIDDMHYRIKRGPLNS